MVGGSTCSHKQDSLISLSDGLYDQHTPRPYSTIEMLTTRDSDASAVIDPKVKYWPKIVISDPVRESLLEIAIIFGVTKTERVK